MVSAQERVLDYAGVKYFADGALLHHRGKTTVPLPTVVQDIAMAIAQTRHISHVFYLSNSKFQERGVGQQEVFNERHECRGEGGEREGREVETQGWRRGGTKLKNMKKRPRQERKKTDIMTGVRRGGKGWRGTEGSVGGDSCVGERVRRMRRGGGRKRERAVGGGG